MPLSSINANVMLQWQLSRSNTGFGDTTEGPDSLNFTLAGVSTTTFNQLLAEQYTITASGSQTVDLTALTNLVYESFGFGHALTVLIMPSGSSVQVQPGATNGFDWFMNSTAVLTIPNGGMLMYSDSPTGTGGVVDSTHKTLTFTNNGATSLTLDIVILGSTT